MIALAPSGPPVRSEAVTRTETLVNTAGSSYVAPGVVPWTYLVFSLVGVALFVGRPVPSGNEWTYLVLLKRAWNPEWLAGDWSLAVPDRAHLVFNLLFGWPTRFLPLEIVAWAGRLGCWSGTLWFLFRVGQRLGIGPRATTGAVLVWVALGQQLVGGEWVFGGFEAKTVAYVLLFASIDGFLRGRYVVPGMLLGLTFSLHPAVGLWSGLTVGGALLATWTPLRQVVTAGGLAVLCALPGAVPLMGMARGSLEDLRFQVLVRTPFHVDPFFFDRGAILASFVLLAFNLAVTWSFRRDRAWRLLAWIQILGAGVFVAGVVARFTETWSLLDAMPFRWFPLLLPLVFLWSLLHVIEQRRRVRLGTGTILLGALALACLPNPVVAGVRALRDNLHAWTTPTDGSALALRWVAENTPTDVTVVAAPEARDAWLLVERPLVATWGHRRRPFAEWRARIESLRGREWSDTPGLSWNDETRQRFDALTEAEVLAVVVRYGGDVLVGSGDYSFPILHEIGGQRVYALPGRSSADSPTNVHSPESKP